MTLLKCSPIVGESFRGWIARIAQANGYPNADWLCRHLLRRRLHQVSLTEAGRHLADGASGVEVLAVLAGIVPGRDHCRHTLRLAEAELPSPFFRLPLRQICPRCLDESGYARGAWETLAVTVCPVHKTRLVSRCPVCGQRLSWLHAGLFHCRCGTDLRNAEPGPGSESLREAQAVLSGEASETVGAHSAVWAVLPAHDRLNLVWTLGVLATGEGIEKRTAIDHAVAAQLAEGAGQALLDWPRPVMKGLARLDRQGPSLRRSLGPAYGWLDAHSANPVLAPLRNLLRQYAAEAREAPVHHQARKALGLTGDPGTVTLTAAAACLATSRRSAARLLSSGHLCGRSARAKERTHVEIDRKAVERYQIQRHRSLGQEKARARLGVGRRRFRELCRAGLVPVLEGPSQTGHAVWRVDRASLDALCATLISGLAGLDVPPPGAVALSTALPTRIRDGELAVTLRAILTGALSPLGRLHDPGVVPSLIVDGKAHQALLEDHRSAQTRTTTIMEAASCLRVKQEVAYHLVTKGLLGTAPSKRAAHRNRRIPLAAIHDFQAKFIWLRDIARPLGTSPKHLAGILEREGIRAVSGPGIDGGRQLLYARSAVAAYRRGSPYAITD